MPGLEQMNIFAVLVGAVASMALGALWYSPLLFGNAWMAAIGKTHDQLGPAGPAMFGSMLSCLLTAAVVEYLLVGLGCAAVFHSGWVPCSIPGSNR